MDHSHRAINRALFLLPVFFFCLSATGQKLREIVILKDTVQEFNKSIGIVEESYVQDGLKLYIVDSVNKVISIGMYKENRLNGDYFAFYLGADMLEKKGTYKDDKKSGTWYYWNKKGMLTRVEQWQDDKLISKKILAK